MLFLLFCNRQSLPVTGYHFYLTTSHFPLPRQNF